MTVRLTQRSKGVVCLSVVLFTIGLSQIIMCVQTSLFSKFDARKSKKCVGAAGH